MRVVKIIGKNTGIGNRILFLQSIDNISDLVLDNELFKTLGIEIPCSKKNHRLNFVLYGYDWRKFWIEKLKNPFGKFYGFKYKVLGMEFSFGYTKAISFNSSIHETDNLKSAWSLLSSVRE